jgi:hypothetical protein
MRQKLSFANVVSVLALFVALGGTGFAASQLGKNTVGTKQLKKNAVTTAKVKKEAITGAKVKKGTLTGKQVNGSTLTGVSAANLGTVQYASAVVTITPGPDGTIAAAVCPTGQKVIGGGAQVSDPKVAFVNESLPAADRNGWLANGFILGGGSSTMTVTAICTPVKTASG